MYESFYNLRRTPFRLTPDPHFFFASSTHKRGLAYLRYALQQGEGFVVICGAPGTGKTELMLNLLKDLPQSRVVWAKLVSTNLSANDLLELVAASFNIPYENTSKGVLLKKLEDLFVHHARIGKRTLLLIDEAHNLSKKSLMELSMLCNFQLGEKPIVQCFLLGQERLNRTLDDPELAHLKQRVIASTTLDVFNEAETEEYILFRLKQAGWRGDPEFAQSTLRLIYQFTGGTPRQINLFCSRLLLQGYLENKHLIDNEIAITVIEELFEETAVAHAPFSLDDEKISEIIEEAEAANHSAAVNERRKEVSGSDAEYSPAALNAGNMLVLPRMRHENISIAREDFPHHTIREHAALDELIQDGANRLQNIVADGHNIDSYAQSIADTFANDRAEENLPLVFPDSESKRNSTSLNKIVDTLQRFFSAIWPTRLNLNNRRVLQGLSAGFVVVAAYFLISMALPHNPAQKLPSTNSAALKSDLAQPKDTSAQLTSKPSQDGRITTNNSAPVSTATLYKDLFERLSAHELASEATGDETLASSAGTKAEDSHVETATSTDQSRSTQIANNLHSDTADSNKAATKINTNTPPVASPAATASHTEADHKPKKKVANLDPQPKQQQAAAVVTLKTKEPKDKPKQSSVGTSVSDNKSQKPILRNPVVDSASAIASLATSNAAQGATQKTAGAKATPNPEAPTISGNSRLATDSTSDTAYHAEISDTELRTLINSLTRTYRNGNLKGFIKFFSADAVSNDESNISDIEKDYRRLFSMTDKRNMTINGIQWSKGNGEMLGKGNFRLTVREKGAGNTVSYDGNINLNVKRHGDDIVITRLIYQYQ